MKKQQTTCKQGGAYFMTALFYVFGPAPLYAFYALCVIWLTGCSIVEPVTKISYENGCVTVPAESYIWTNFNLNPRYDYVDLVFVVNDSDTLTGMINQNIDEPSCVHLGSRVKNVEVLLEVFDSGEGEEDYFRKIGRTYLSLKKIELAQH